MRETETGIRSATFRSAPGRRRRRVARVSAARGVNCAFSSAGARARARTPKDVENSGRSLVLQSAAVGVFVDSAGVSDIILVYRYVVGT